MIILIIYLYKFEVHRQMEDKYHLFVYFFLRVKIFLDQILPDPQNILDRNVVNK